MKKETREYYVEAINRAIEFIESNSSERISLEEIAEYALISTYHFHRIFKSIVGHTTKEYLVRLRLEKAALLLRNTQKSISGIAYECGYSSPEIFTRGFKAYFSTTPTLFREGTKQQIEAKQAIHQNTSFESLNISPPKILEKPDLNLACIRHVGEYDKVGQSFQKLMIWAAKRLVLKLRPTTIGIVHDNPDLTAKQHRRFDACLLLTKAIQPQGVIGYKQISGGKFAVFRYKGPYEALYTIYDYIYHRCLFDYQWELRDEPALEWYIHSPPLYRPEQLLTDIYLPIV